MKTLCVCMCVYVCTWMQFSSACLDERYSQNNNSWADNSFEATCTIWSGIHWRGQPKGPQCFLLTPSQQQHTQHRLSQQLWGHGSLEAQLLSLETETQTGTSGGVWRAHGRGAQGPSPAYWQGQHSDVEVNMEMQVANILQHEAPLPTNSFFFFRLVQQPSDTPFKSVFPPVLSSFSYEGK